MVAKGQLVHDNHNLPHAAVCAAKMYLHSMRKLQVDAPKAYEDLKQTGRQVRNAIEAHIHGTSGAIQERSVEAYQEQVLKVEQLLPEG